MKDENEKECRTMSCLNQRYICTYIHMYICSLFIMLRKGPTTGVHPFHNDFLAQARHLLEINEILAKLELAHYVYV